MLAMATFHAFRGPRTLLPINCSTTAVALLACPLMRPGFAVSPCGVCVSSPLICLVGAMPIDGHSFNVEGICTNLGEQAFQYHNCLDPLSSVASSGENPACPLPTFWGQTPDEVGVGWQCRCKNTPLAASAKHPGRHFFFTLAFF